ncbi:hypothetical protein [Thiobacillus denitrificans]|uniref:Uncharacterized protein n=1 Tax=Thiobacillus denitrificans TaxID=36861 RepID=A0A106BHI6_THIDE|nr:hypothetical protein [Thiobacillus denitrificans]KVW92634.1 hypothetical protein ABW22_15770 [Thiobacillus denitrificans]
MLTDSQKDRARFDGGKDQANRRRQLRQLRTGLINVRRDAAMPTDDNVALTEAVRALDRLLVEVENDLSAAKNIKRDWDQHVALAHALLVAIPLPGVADIIALGELAHEIGYPRMLLNDIENYGWNHAAATLKRNALDSLAHRCASDAKPPTEFVAAIRATMPAAAARHADLIRQITTLAVSEQLQKTAAQPAGGK